MAMGDWRRKKTKMFTLFLEEIGGTNPATFQSVFKDDIPILEDLVQVNIFLYDINFVDRAMIGELARRSVGRHSSTVCSLSINTHSCYVFVIIVLKAYRCLSCGTFLNGALNL